jgi:MscS family membrane protein
MNLGLRYGVKADALRKIIAELKSVIDSYAEKGTENYVIFESFGETSLNLAIQYFIAVKPNREFLQQKEEMNLRFMEVVERHGAEFYFPFPEVKVKTSESPMQT